MAEEVVSKAINEIRNANEDELRKVIEQWLERTRTDGMKLGAQMISAVVFDTMKKNLGKAKPSLRDYERCIKDIRKIIAVQLTKQNDSEEIETSEVVEETSNDRTTDMGGDVR